MKTPEHIHIIGGGIIGLCSAWYLQQEGCRVTVIDDYDFSDGTSFGNAGMIVPSHFIPMANPGIISKGIKWLLDPKSPFSIKPRFNLELIQWLWYFYRSAQTKKTQEVMSVLHDLNMCSKSLYKELSAKEGFNFDFNERGLLMLYKTKKQEQEEKHVLHQAHQLGVKAHLLDIEGLKELEPGMAFNAMGGVYFPDDAHLCPNVLIRQLIARLKTKGVLFKSDTSIKDFKLENSKITALFTKNNEVIPTRHVLVTAGSWTALLLKKMGVKIHLQDGKGYSVTLDNIAQRPHIPTILTEAKVAITPMMQQLRISGTLEISGLSKTVNKKCVDAIMSSLSMYYKNLDMSSFDEHTKIWKGYRPCSPDGMPYIGKSNVITNLFVGTGHGMMGLSLGAITGKLLSELITEQKTTLPLKRFGIDRPF